jgi:hypothetical protein
MQDFIIGMPGYISIISLDMRYVLVNKNLSVLLGGILIEGQFAGSACKAQEFQIRRLINSPIGSTVTWEYFYGDMCLEVLSTRHEGYILSQAFDVSSIKVLEQELRDANDKNKLLIKSMSGATHKLQLENIDNIANQIKENNLRIQSIESLVFRDDCSLLIRMKALEINEENNKENLDEIISRRNKLESLSSFIGMFSSLGGLKTIAISFVVLQMLGIFLIDVGIRYLNLTDFIPIEQKKD